MFIHVIFKRYLPGGYPIDLTCSPAGNLIELDFMNRKVSNTT